MTKEESFLKNSYPIILTPDAGGYVVEIRILQSGPRAILSRKLWRWLVMPSG